VNEERLRPRIRRPHPSSFAVSGWALLIVLAGLIAGVVLLTRNGCDNDFAGYFRVRNVTVDTWAEWCDYLNNVDIHAKYGALYVSYEADSVRADFVLKARPDLIHMFTDAYGDSGTVRVWQDRTFLHFGDGNNHDNIRLELALKERFKEDWSRLPNEQFMVNATIASLFTDIVLHDSRGRTTRLPMPFLFGK